MALVKCADCNYEVSNKSMVCPKCGNEMKGECRRCIYYEELKDKEWGLCKAADKEDYVSRYKSVCPGMVKKEFFTL